MLFDYTPMDPHDLIRLITAECYCMLALKAEHARELDEPEDPAAPEEGAEGQIGFDSRIVELHLKGLALIGEAWELREETEAILQKLREYAEDPSSSEPQEDEHVDEQILTVLWGLFDTAVRLDAQEDRELIRQLAGEITDFHGLDIRVQAL